MLSDDYRPNKFALSNGEVRATGILCGGAIQSIAQELLEVRTENLRMRELLETVHEWAKWNPDRIDSEESGFAEIESFLAEHP